MKDIEKFVKGFTRFQQNYFSAEDSLYSELRNGQHPSTL
ncbi:MAG: carbonic anhydrase, partial [Burkholderiales bacterium]|nr:carbonic anhydrase [Burkholderiales bacterium]